MASGYEPAAESTEECLTPAVKARNWFISSYPLLVALASSFKIIEDPAVCARMDNVTPESMAERVKVRGRGGTVFSLV